MASADIKPGEVANAALDELYELREALLDYDAASDKSGDRWDALRIKLDRRILVSMGLVRMLAHVEAKFVEIPK